MYVYVMLVHTETKHTCIKKNPTVTKFSRSSKNNRKTTYSTWAVKLSTFGQTLSIWKRIRMGANQKMKNIEQLWCTQFSMETRAQHYSFPQWVIIVLLRYGWRRKKLLFSGEYYLGSGSAQRHRCCFSVCTQPISRMGWKSWM